MFSANGRWRDVGGGKKKRHSAAKRNRLLQGEKGWRKAASGEKRERTRGKEEGPHSGGKERSPGVVRGGKSGKVQGRKSILTGEGNGEGATNKGGATYKRLPEEERVGTAEVAHGPKGESSGRGGGRTGAGLSMCTGVIFPDTG